MFIFFLQLLRCPDFVSAACAVDHAVAVGAEGDEFGFGVNLMGAFLKVVWVDVVNFYVVFTNLAVCFFEVETTADAVDAASLLGL